MKNLFEFCLAFSFLVLFSSLSAAQAGGQFAITQSVIANGGANSDGGNFGVTGTTAQPNAGDNSAGGQFSIESGFWQAFFPLTAAQVSVSGRVTTATGVGIANTRVSITNLTGGAQTAVTGSFGYFRFPEIPVGETYILTVHSRRYQFSNRTQVIYVSDDIGNLIFIADFEGN